MIYEACTGHDVLDLELGEMDFPRGSIEDLAHQLPKPGLSCVMRDDSGMPLACFGISPLWPGVGEAWAFISQEAMQHSIALSRSVKRQLELVQSIHGFRRIQAIVKDEHLDGHRWVRWLGFEAEGIMHEYGYNGIGSYWMYAKRQGVD